MQAGLVILACLAGLGLSQSDVRPGRWSPKRRDWEFICPPGKSIARVQHKLASDTGVLRLKFKCKDFVPAGISPGDVLDDPIAKARIPIQEENTAVNFGNIFAGSFKDRVLVGISGEVVEEKLIIRQHFAKYKKAKVDETMKCVIRAGDLSQTGMIASGLSPNTNCPQFANEGLQVSEGRVGFKFCAIRFEEAEYDESCSEVVKEEGQQVEEETGAKEVVETTTTEEGETVIENYEEEFVKTETIIEEEEKKKEEGEVTIEETQEQVETTREEFLEKTTVETVEYTEEQETVIEEVTEEIEESVSEKSSSKKHKTKSKKHKTKSKKHKTKSKKHKTKSKKHKTKSKKHKTKSKKHKTKSKHKTKHKSSSGSGSGSGSDSSSTEVSKSASASSSSKESEACICICAQTCEAGNRRRNRGLQLRRGARTALAQRRTRKATKTRKTTKTRRTTRTRTTTTRTRKVTRTKKVTKKTTIKKHKFKGKLAYLVIMEDEIELCPEEECNCCDACD